MRGRLSIFATLVLWFTLAGFLILGAMSYFLLRTFEQSQRSEQRDALWSKVVDVANNLQREEDALLAQGRPELLAPGRRDGAWAQRAHDGISRPSTATCASM